MIRVERKLHPLFGAELAGVSAREPLSAQDASEFLSQVAKHGVALLRGPQATEEQFVRFAQSLGRLWNFTSAARDDAGEAPARAFDFTNRGNEGQPLSSSDAAVAYLKVNELWHTDSTYVRPGATYSMLAANVLPQAGGDTEFCDMRVAYETLPDELQHKLQPVNAYHSLRYSMARVGFVDPTEIGDATRRAAISRPLVRLQDETGRNALWLASHVGALDG